MAREAAGMRATVRDVENVVAAEVSEGMTLPMDDDQGIVHKDDIDIVVEERGIAAQLLTASSTQLPLNSGS